MKLLIFAGGAGTRLWPLSRKNSPKQFRPIFNNKSTLQLALERVTSFGLENVVVSTNKNYVDLIKQQLPQLKTEQIVGEPEKRNLAPAVGFNLVKLRKQGYKGPIAILWADQLMEKIDNFVAVLKRAESLVTKDPTKLVFIGEKARYAENNLGWIHLGKKLEEGMFEFLEWTYKPEMERCKKIFASGEWVWNPGYFIMDLDKALGLYQEHLPEMYKQLTEIEEDLETKREEKTIEQIYPAMESIAFDRLIEKVPSEQAVVLPTDLGWSDPGTLYAFKEALVGQGEQNLIQGLVETLDTKDCLIINEEDNKLVATIGIDGVMVVNTPDALIVVSKEKVVQISKLVEELGKKEELKKFI